MPVPFVGAFLSQAMQGIATQVTSALGGSGAMSRATDYVVNNFAPNVLPSIDMLLKIDKEEREPDREHLARAFIAQGVLPSPDAGHQAHAGFAQHWELVRQANKDKPDAMSVFQAGVYGRIDTTDEEIDKRYKWDNVNKKLAPMFYKYLEVPEVYAAWSKGIITDPNQFRKFVQWGGAFNSETNTVMNELYKPKLTVADYTVLWNRNYYSEDQWREKVRRTAGFYSGEVDELALLSQNPPGPSDLVRFAVREAFDDEQARRLGLDDEYEGTGSFQYWMDAQGAGKTLSFENTQQGEVVEWSKLYWRSHWELMAPGQAEEAFHRCRPNRLYRWKDTIPFLEPFNYDDLTNLLKTADYLPKQRQWLAAISFGKVEKRVARQMYAFDLIDKQELIELFMDDGMIKIDAERAARAEEIKKPYTQKRYLIPPLNKYDNALIGQIVENFRVGAINGTTLRNLLLPLLVDETSVDRYVNSEVLRKKNRFIKEFTNTVRRSYFTGEVTELGAFEYLISGGLNFDYVQNLIQLWKVALDLPRKVVAAGKLADWYRRGLITKIDLEDRLVRLGYREDSVVLQIADADRLIELDKVKQAELEARKAKAAAKELKALAREQAAARNKFRTTSVVKRWFKEGLISSGQVSEYLSDMGVPDTDLENWLSEITGEE